jgi:hypothetical protein
VSPVPTVTLAELRSLGACAEGLADFERAFPSGGAALPDAVGALPNYAPWYAVTSRRPEALRRLTSDPDPNVRKCVALNAHAPPDVLQALTSDPDPNVAFHALHALETL